MATRGILHEDNNAAQKGHKTSWREVDWNAVLENQVEADHIFLRSGLIHKVRILDPIKPTHMPPFAFTQIYHRNNVYLEPFWPAG